MFRSIICLLLCGMLTSSWAQFINPRTGAPQSAPTRPAVTQPTPKPTSPAQTPARRPPARRPATRSSSQRSANREVTQPVISSDSGYVQIYLTNGSIVKCVWVEATPTEIIYRDTLGTIWRVPRSQVSEVVVKARPPGSTSALMPEQKVTTTTTASTTPVAASSVAVPTEPIAVTVATPTSVTSTPVEKSAKVKKAEQKKVEQLSRADKLKKADQLSKASKARRMELIKREVANKVAAKSTSKREQKTSVPVQKRNPAVSAGGAFVDGGKFLEFSLGLEGSRSKISGAALPANQTISALSISPTIRYGVFTRENVAFGGGIQVTFDNQAPTDIGERKITTYSPFAFVRRNLPLNESIALYGEGRLGVDYQTDKFSQDTLVLSQQNRLTPMIRLSGGATVRLGERWWLNGQATLVGINYNRRTFGPDTKPQANLELIGRNTRSLFTLSVVRFF